MAKNKFSKISSIIQDAKKGKMFILVDDKNRENEVLSFNQEQIIKDSNTLLKEVSNISLFDRKKIFILNKYFSLTRF